MFLFKCCQADTTDTFSPQCYQITTFNNKNEEVITFVSTLDDLQPEIIKNNNNKILSVNKSKYDELIAQYKGTNQKWTDMQFSPTTSNIGQIEGVANPKWKRISEIIKDKPVLFDGKVEPRDVIQGSLGDCYFLSALAALAQQQERIKRVFGKQQYNPNGIYKVQLRIDGIVSQILVDDFIPINSNGQPLFCQPNKNQFWVLILEKAWAKAHGSYANIVAGNPTQVFKAVTYAPSEMLIVKEKEQDREKLWRKIVYYADRNFPCCCGTDDKKQIEWEKLNLVPGHAYTLIDANELKSQDGKINRMLKLRNPWGKTEWEGQGSQNDRIFWQKIQNTQQKKLFLKDMERVNDGIFFITYKDFCKYFSQVHFCMQQPNGNYVVQQLLPYKKNGSLFEVQITSAGQYIFQVHQSGIRGESEERQKEGLSRATIVVGKCQDNDIQFIDGVLKFNQEDATLNVRLTPGNYIVFGKLDPTKQKKLLPKQLSISVYSVHYTYLKPAPQKKYGQFLKKMFINHGKFNKRQSYNDNKMWIGWKLLFQQGGYAYICFSNAIDSKKKFVITFNEKDFDQQNLKLKKPYKKKGDNLILQVMPGSQQIILARVKNTQIKTMKFPPPLGIKMQPVN